MVMTVTSTTPEPGGETAVIWTSESTVNAGASTPPKATVVAPVKPWPPMTTLVPPAAGPLAGVNFATAGIAA